MSNWQDKNKCFCHCMLSFSGIIQMHWFNNSPLVCPFEWLSIFKADIQRSHGVCVRFTQTSHMLRDKDRTATCGEWAVLIDEKHACVCVSLCIRMNVYVWLNRMLCLPDQRAAWSAEPIVMTTSSTLLSKAIEPLAPIELKVSLHINTHQKQMG